MKESYPIKTNRPSPVLQKWIKTPASYCNLMTIIMYIQHQLRTIQYIYIISTLITIWHGRYYRGKIVSWKLNNVPALTQLVTEPGIKPVIYSKSHVLSTLSSYDMILFVICSSPNISNKIFVLGMLVCLLNSKRLWVIY